MLKPLRGYVLVEQIDDTETTASGLVLPETAKDKPCKGVVLACGEDVRKGGNIAEGYEYDFCPVKVKDKVVYKKWSTNDLEEDGKTLAFIKFEDILGRYE